MRFITTSIERLAIAGLAFAGACLAITFVVHGSELSDAGWTIARPKTVLDAKHLDSPRTRIAINQVLEQGRVPLLQSPAVRPAEDITPEESSETPAEVTTEELTAEFVDAPVIVEDSSVVEEPPAVEESSTAEETSEAAIDTGPQIVFGTYGASADGWRPANLSSGFSRAPASNERDTVAPPTRRFRPVASGPSTTVTTKPEAAATKPKPDESAAKRSISAETFETRRNAAAQREQAETETIDAEQAKPPVVEEPAEPLPPLTRNMRNLRTKIRRVVKSYYTRPLNSRDNDPWELMHGMLAYGVHSQIRQGSPRGDTITLVGWLCYNKPSKGFTLLYLTPENELRAKHGVGLQGHMGQFLAMLAQCQVSPDYPIRVRNQEFSINDLIEAEQKTCYPKSELTFKLIALMHYLDTDASWVNDQGQSWDIPRLIREELAQPIRSAACGGTHRLSGLSLAARTRVRRGEPLDGEYLRAAQYVEKYEKYALQLQNRDGSLSTAWFRGRGDENDIDRRVKTTGHILEWLCYSLDDQEVRSSRTFSAANYLSSLMSSNFNHDWEVGPLSHAIHALRLYDERVFQPYDEQDNVAKKPARKTAQRAQPSAARTHTMGF